jgi:hypothetical protein
VFKMKYDIYKNCDGNLYILSTQYDNRLSMLYTKYFIASILLLFIPANVYIIMLYVLYIVKELMEFVSWNRQIRKYFAIRNKIEF